MSKDNANKDAVKGLVLDDLYLVQRIDRLPLTSYFVLIILAVGFGFFFDIYDIDTMSATAAVITKQWHLTPLLTTLSIAMGFLGMFVGSLISGWLADRMGRKQLFVVTLAIVAIGSFLTAFAANVVELWIFRFITGIGIGGDMPVLWAYLTELSPSRYRGMFMGLSMIIGVASLPAVGLAASYFISTFPVNGWRYVFLTGAIIAVAVYFVRALAPESPRWLLSHGKKDEAERVMEKIEQSIQRRFKKPLPDYDKSTKYMIGEYRAPLREIFRRDVAPSTAIATILWIFQTWGFYGFTAFLPLILIAKGFTLIHAIIYTAISWAGGLLGPILVSLIGEKFERKYLLATWAGLAALFMIVMGILPVSAVAGIVASAFLVNTFIQAWASTLYTYVPELFPTRVRATGGGFANAMGRGFNIVGLMVVGVLLAGLPLYQLTFTAVSWLVCLITALLGRRTSGLKLEDITERKAQ